MKKQTLLLAVLLLVFLFSGQVQAETIRSIYITGGGWNIGAPADPTHSAYNPFTHVSGDDLSIGHALNDDILMGTFQGSPGFTVIGTDTFASRTTGIVGFEFGIFGGAAGYTSPDRLFNTSNPSYGINLPPTGTIDTLSGAYTLNMESWTWGWNGLELSHFLTVGPLAQWLC